jgi:hypothetical protein
MTYIAEVQFKFDATFTPTYGSSSWSDDDFIPEEHYLITAPAADLNCKQYYKLFEKFLLCVGMDPEIIRSSAMSLVFNDCVGEDEQRKICKEYELTMDEDLEKKYQDFKQRDEDWAKLKKGPMGTVLQQGEDESSWEERYWALYKRFNQFAKFTDDQLSELAQYGDKQYFMGND